MLKCFLFSSRFSLLVFLKDICKNAIIQGRLDVNNLFSGNVHSGCLAEVLIVQLFYFRILIGYRQRNMCLNRHPATHS